MYSIFKRLIILIISLNAFATFGQQLSTFELKLAPENEDSYLTKTIQIPVKTDQPFVSMSIALNGNDIDAAVVNAFYKNVDHKWVLFESNGHEQMKDKWTAMSFLDSKSESTQIKIIFKSAQKVDDIQVNFYFPGNSSDLTEQKTSITNDDCGCPQPTIISRNTWCPGNNCPPNTSPVATDVKFLIVHHTAGSNTSSDWAAVVRSIWNFHVNTNGWADIGYNFLVDKLGNIYSGRADDTRGAHFSGFNTNTSGMALMGNFTSQVPDNQLISGLESLLVWKSCNKNIDPLSVSFHSSSGQNLNAISGHRDSGASTECPGQQVYDKLGDIRTNVNTLLTTCKLGVDDYIYTQFNIYPNPVKDYFNIEPKFANPYQLTLYNVLGQIVYSRKELEGHIRLDLSEYTAGVYLMRLRTATESFNHRFIKR